jgi:hypothetical protein
VTAAAPGLLKLRRTDLHYPEAGWPPNEDRLVVLFEERMIGSLGRIGGGPQDNSWRWSITALYVPPGVMMMHGTAETKEEAKAAFAKTLRKWLTHIGATELTDEVVAKHRIGSRRG